MKTLSLTLLLALSFGMVAVPASARTGVEVNFAFKASELTTDQSRSALIERMKATTEAQCSGKLSEAYPTTNKCAADLEKQYLKAIGHPALIAQYNGNAVRIASNGS